MLGCTQQTISNYADSGYFDYMKADRALYIDRESFLSFVEKHFEHVRRVEDIEAALAEREKQANEAKEKAKAKHQYWYAHIQHLGVSNAILPLFRNYIKKMAAKGGLTEKELDIFCDVVDGVSPYEYHSQSRRVYERAMLKIMHNMQDFDKMQEEIAHLHRRNKRLHDALKMHKVAEKTEKAPVMDDLTLSLKSVLLKDESLSVRTMRCLQHGGVETAYDLLSLDTQDLLKFRNFGKKCLDELYELVDKLSKRYNGVHWAMYCKKGGGYVLYNDLCGFVNIESGMKFVGVKALASVFNYAAASRMAKELERDGKKVRIVSYE